MTLPSARRTALTALAAWRQGKRFADSIIGDLLADTRLVPADRGFALELFYGVLRNLTLLDYWIGRLRPSHIDVDLRDILRLGFYQLLLTDTSAHAAVYETVELAKTKQRGVINGILRNALRKRSALLLERKTQPLHVRTSHPEFLIKRWEKHLGTKNADALCTWDNQPPPTYARINQLKIDRDSFLRTYPETTAPPGESNFAIFQTFSRDALDRGHCYVQDPSTALACRLLDPRPGETILDACAAPGGKTGYLAELMENRGHIVACDRDNRRTETLRENLARLGVKVARVCRCDWAKGDVPKEVTGRGPLDRILVDAPCSNTGVMRRRVDVRWRLRPSDFVKMPQEQMSILREIIPLLKSGGTLVYSTCSLEPEENEGVSAQIVKHFPGMLLKDEQRVLPYRDHLDGAFAAKFIRA